MQKVTEKEFIISKKVGTVDKYNFYEYIAIMLDGGVGITEALDSVHSKITSPYFRQKISDLIIFISSGDSFSKSMKKIPDIFSNSETSVIEAGEATGNLSEALLKLSNDLKKIHDLKNKIKNALTYPIIIFIVLILAIVIIMTYVVPALKPLFDNSEAELPLSTQALIGVSDFVVANSSILILLFVSIIGALAVYISSGSGKRKFENFIIDFPLVGKVYRNYILANVASTLGNLVGSGVSIVKSLKLTGNASNSILYQEMLDKVASRVASGEKIVFALQKIDKEGKFFPADYLQMLAVGEKTASVETVSKKINNQYEKEVDYALANMTKVIEPIAILIAGVFIIWFCFAVFGAIIQLTQTI